MHTHTFVNTHTHKLKHTNRDQNPDCKDVYEHAHIHTYTHLSTVPQTKKGVHPCASAPGGDMILHPPLNPHMIAHKHTHTDINPPPCLTACFEE